ncbi:MAG: AmmeMemoRadiSam system radical SAM enzyme [Desulfobacteraceae bacterium]|nr:AmmeMemoRadiSam system radical SAM enzyme [Desulfobacteraceae bacterium]MBC2757910.1 AmmeMemoRadiSam system radical SAM enzyme [Desulfobacteraceae bacterium]
MKTVSRRQFLTSSALALASNTLPVQALCALSGKNQKSDQINISGKVFKNDAPRKLWKWSREADYYMTLPGDAVVCGICPHSCVLDKGDRSICRSRVNINGKLYTLAYGNPCSVNTDPIEKKPLFHFKPASRALSIATTGCNFRCLNCQNWQISQVKPEDVRFKDLFPKQVIETAMEKKAASIAYTYSEPITYFEYMMDTARLAKQKGISNLWISNGYINPEPLSVLCEVLDAANVNLKSFNNETYQKLNGGQLDPVLNTFKTLHEQGVHFEITTLVVPGYVDDPKMIKKMCQWIVNNLGPDHPLHFLRFFPQYKLDRLPPTPVSVLTNFRKIAMNTGIRYVYVGNVPRHEGNHTYCHQCGKLLIERKGYHIPTYNIEKNKCRFCKSTIPGKWI